METETYSKEFICKNCGSSQTGIINKGVTVDTYCKINDCKNCGCNTLRKKTNND